MDEPLTLPRDSARQRALRIPLAYHRENGPLGAWRLAITLACFLAGGVYFAWVLAGGKPAATQVSPGTLAKDHARWESDCQACHVPLVPQRPDAEGTRTLALSLSNSTVQAAHQSADAKCSACHKSAGAHHSQQLAAEVESCASCHRDHQGRDFDMARMDDAHCTRCHASIAAHRTNEGSQRLSPIVNVMSFDFPPADANSGHPPFRSLQSQEDPGNIRFSHRLHMALGQLYPGQTAAAGKRLVQLACDACHQPETTTGNGAYMWPIKYEQHCRSCHPLTMPGQPQAVVPHGLPSKQLENVVRGLIAEEAKQPRKIVPSKRPIPGKNPARSLTDNPQPPSELVATQRLAELRQNKCSQCHSWQEQNLAEVKPAKIPAVWLEFARFNHQKHQNAAKCQDCHTQAIAKLPVGGVPGQVADDNEVMIPNIDNCARCHAPRNESASTGGARFDCAECHRYHQPPPPEKPLRNSGLSRIQNLEGATSPESLLVTFVADRVSQPLPTKGHSFVGTASCSATGCHGAPQGQDLTASYTRFTADDPHTRAFLLLYTQPSLNIYRRLTNQPQAKLEDAEYFSFLQQNCIGCHATPPADAERAIRPESYASGISCESCHGPAADWEFTHFDRKAKKSPGMRNLVDLSVRATTCAECHIGPQFIEGKTYDVNHDLIVAGHPRLTLEFEAQFANLPSHWSMAKNVKSHLEAWRIGELATAAQQDKLHTTRAASEFASHRCFDCHHGLTPKPASGRTPFPPRTGISPHERKWLAEPAFTQREQAALLRKLLDLTTDKQVAGSSGTRWEEHVRLSLGLAAFAADNSQDAALTKNADDLREILANSFRALPREKNQTKEPFFAGGAYDSPTGFEPSDERLKQVLDKIRAQLPSP